MIFRLSAAILVAGIISTGVANAAIVPNDRDRAALARGEAMQLTIDVFQDPGICGIVLERQRCKRDLGPAPEFAAFLNSGDLDSYNPKWGEANSTMVPPSEWKANPRNAWLETGGILSILARWPRNPITNLFAVPLLDSMARYATAAGPYAALIPPKIVSAAKRTPSGQSSVDPAQASSFQSLLVSQLEKLFGVAPFPSPVFSDSRSGDIRLGIYTSTLQELIDNPIGLSEPSSRAFGKMIVQRWAELAPPSTRAAVERLVSSLTNDFPDPRVDRRVLEAMRKDLTDVTDAALHVMPDQRKRDFLLGDLTAQVAFNAAVLKELPSDVKFRGWIAELQLPTASLQPDFTALTAAQPADWRTVNQAATRATLDLMQLP